MKKTNLLKQIVFMTNRLGMICYLSFVKLMSLKNVGF